MLERKCIKSYRSLQHRNGVTKLKQVENQSRNHALRKRNCCQYIPRTEIRFVSTDYSIPLLHTLVWCDQLCEQPNDVMYGDTSLFDNFHCNNVRSLSERLLLLVKHLQSASNWALQCLQSIHLGLSGKLTFHCCASSHIVRTEKAFQHIKLTLLRMYFASGSLLFKYK